MKKTFMKKAIILGIVFSCAIAIAIAAEKRKQLDSNIPEDAIVIVEKEITKVQNIGYLESLATQNALKTLMTTVRVYRNIYGVETNVQ